MQFAHNGSYKGSIPFGLTDVSSDPLAGAPKGSRCVKTYGLWRFSQRTGAILALEAPTTQCGGASSGAFGACQRVLGRVWFMALVLKTSTSKKS